MFDPAIPMTWEEVQSSCMNDGGDLMRHETLNELEGFQIGLHQVFISIVVISIHCGLVTPLAQAMACLPNGIKLLPDQNQY